jgi:hypothetical protein
MLDDIQKSFGTPHVNDGTQSTEGKAENRYRFSHPRERSTPRDIGYPQDGTDERPCVANADEEDKVDDVNPPENGSVQASDLQAVDQLVRPSDKGKQEN